MSAESKPGRCRTASAYAPAGPDALLRLGLDVYAPLEHLRPAFERLLPAAFARGYFGALRDALARGEVAPSDDEDQLRWLAEHLHLAAPADDDFSASWKHAWQSVRGVMGEPMPEALNLCARRVLLNELLSRPRYRQRLADALAEAVRAQLSR